jgi:hypothetical protein
MMGIPTPARGDAPPPSTFESWLAQNGGSGNTRPGNVPEWADDKYSPQYQNLMNTLGVPVMPGQSYDLTWQAGSPPFGTRPDPNKRDV